MALDININLSDDDLAHFIDAMHKAQEKAKDKTPQEISAAARKMLLDTRDVKVPDFIAARLERLDMMISMGEDDGFALPEDDRARVLAVLSYFADPADVIDDSVPVLGFLDDAIMIELCQRELQFEIDAYDDFRDWRLGEAEARGVDLSTLKVQRHEWAEARRAEAIELMRHRRRESYASGAWAPVLFRVN